MASGAMHMEFWIDQTEPCLGILQHLASLYDGPEMAIERQMATKAADISATYAFRELQEIKASQGAQRPQGDERAARDTKHRDPAKSTKSKTRDEVQQRRHASESESHGWAKRFSDVWTSARSERER